jgi:spermidine synthase
MTTLSELAKKHNTDKLLHGYTEFYPRYMEPLRDTASKVVEIGIGYGASVRMWLEYFTTAHIYAIDNEEEAVARVWDSLSTNRLSIMKANQLDPTIWDIIGDGIDFVIDDASHRPEDQIATFKLGFKHVRPGGFYICEDTQCSFHTNFSNDFDMLYSWLKKLMVEQVKFAINDWDFYVARDSDPNNRNSLASMIYSFACYKNVIMFERAYD